MGWVVVWVSCLFSIMVLVILVVIALVGFCSLCGARCFLGFGDIVYILIYFDYSGLLL